MAHMYESGLFTELGDLLGHDPTLYEESDVSSFYGDITKHSYSTSSLHDNNVMGTATVLEPLSSTAVSSDTAEIDGLLSEGNMLIDQLMAENGLDLMTEPVELANVDELVANEVKFNNVLFDNTPVSDLFAQFYEPTNELCQQTPESPVSTLPSEPSSPVDVFELAASVVTEPTAAVSIENSTVTDASDELDDLLSSLLDEGHSPQSGSSCFDDQFVSSPDSSSSSDYGNGSECSNDYDEDSFSYSCSPAPEKAKTPKKKKSSTPYSKLPAGRKEKKKLQNKEAAIRYRQKKKGETQVLVDEESQLQEINDKLNAEVLNLEREIMCMKELLSDVFNIHSI